MSCRSLAFATCLAFALLTVGVAAAPAATTPELGDLRQVGTVAFPTSCDSAVQQKFERAVALLHSFFYGEARRAFTEVAERDPECAIAYWGIAMTYYHPIWAAPDASELAAGLAAVEKALAAKKVSERERGYIRAVEAFYKGLDAPHEQATEAMPSCHGVPRADPTGRAACFRREMEQVAARYPQDVDAAAFYALSLLGTAPPGDTNLAQQRQAAEILEKWYAEKRNHPGLAHYLIHSYDYPPLAERGLPAARAYAAMAPWVPHALHMPSHIFTRLGMWQETIESNLASADAARRYAAGNHPDAASFEELHALDYLAYAYLQTTRDDEARQVVERLREMRKTHPESDVAVAYAFGAIPARYALERRQWAEAAQLELLPGSFWRSFPFAEGLTVYARAVGAARSGKLEAAGEAAARLAELAAATEPRFRYFADQMGLQRQAVQGLVALARGEREEAVKILREAAEREDALGKHPVSPGAILPVRELLGEALLEAGRPAEALSEFEAALAIYPARFNGVCGAARAASRAGRDDVARRYYDQLVALAQAGQGRRPELTEARSYLARR